MRAAHASHTSVAEQGAALSCLPGNYAFEADGVSSCVACDAGTFKSFTGPGACLSCPGDGVSAEEGRSCACGAGHFLKDNVPMLSCSGESSETCPCTPSVGSNDGTLIFQADPSDMDWQSCASIIISGVEPRVTVAWLQVQNVHLVLYVDECDDADCNFYNTVVPDEWISISGWEYQSSMRHLRVRFQWYVRGGYSMASGSLVATWSTTSKPPVCSPCEAGDYKDTTDAACTACPSNA
ncbi:hypothetical protein T484DRAFT_1790504, partial [Baffinella frigidus]